MSEKSRKTRIYQPDWPLCLREDEWLKDEDVTQREAEEIWQALALQPGIDIFDCPCGDARISIHFARKGARVYGLDINQHFVNRARQRFEDENLFGVINQGDMREASLPEGCDLLLNWFNSFGYYDDEDNKKMIKVFSEAIRPGGYLLLESPNMRHIMQNIYEKRHDEDDQVITEWEDCDHCLYIYEAPTHEKEEVVCRIRIYSLEEYERMFSEVGLVVEKAFDEHFSSFSEDSRRLILLARKQTMSPKNACGIR